MNTSRTASESSVRILSCPSVNLPLPPEFLWEQSETGSRRNAARRSISNELAEKEKNGIREFKNADEDNRETFLFYDAACCTRRKDGALLYKVPRDMCIINEKANKHHDIISYYGDDDYDVVVVDNGEGELFLEVHFAAEEEFVEFSNGEWYFA